jgi:hypothetical protein
MKKLLLSAILLATSLMYAQETVNISMGAGYTNEVYYKLDSQAETIFTASSWDIAFLRNSNVNVGVRVNDGIGINVYQVANTPAGYNTVNVTDQSNWTELTNSDTSWNQGAFMNASATYGFGEYNPITNTVEGSIVFVLEYSDGTFRKFFIESYFGAYDFKYATWDGAAWSLDTNSTVANTTNPENIYNYYSLQNGEEVVAEPAEEDWDFVFRKYTTFLDPPGQFYNVTGVLHNPNVTVAQNEETGPANPNGLTYLEEMNTIGFDWKSFTGAWEIDSDQKYYVKYNDNSVYRLYFTDFEGTSSGNLTFEFEDVSGLLGFESITENVSFGMFPNPSSDGRLTILYENLATTSATNTIRIFAMSGAEVFTAKFSNNSGLFNKTLDLSSLQSGIYMVAFKSGDTTVTKKLILN